YWYSQVLFTAIELELFRYLENGSSSVEDLAIAAACKPEELLRLLKAMERMGLVMNQNGNFYNTQVAALYLVPDKKDFMGDFFLYRQYMIPQWKSLTQKILTPSKKQDKPPESELTYAKRNLRYVAAMDTLVKQKAIEIARLLKNENISGPILDIGGGAGSLIRTIQGSTKNKATLLDIPEVIEAAQEIYPDDNDWQGIRLIAGDFRTHEFKERFGLICLSNFLHAYGPSEAKELFFKSISLLDPNGLVLIHDYFPDRKGTVPQKGALYDLSMMLNTYNGVCHDSKTIIAWFKEAGFNTIAVKDLSTDTAVIMARKKGAIALNMNPLQEFALDLNIDGMVPIAPGDIVTVPWAREKCRFGCERFEKGLQCPPHGMNHEKTRQVLDSYAKAFLVKGTPPGKDFHNTLLSLQNKAFLEGFHKAFVFGAGPCLVCPQCPEDGKCKFPHLARPSMEGSGIDVYTTASNAGMPLTPVKEKSQYVTYIGLLLVE
ncbi:MAG: methyltransferase domain-containing protein, partial [Proteobacteria bacterium]|nr:methyltransferase domain-containing protein [Pseudomonadota bacterium]